MDIRTFRASTLQEALEQVRETLGPDAAVLHTREVKRSRLGLFSSSLVEVDASVEVPGTNRLANASRQAPATSPADSTATTTAPVANSVQTGSATPAANAESNPTHTESASRASETAASSPSPTTAAEPSPVVNTSRSVIENPSTPNDSLDAKLKRLPAAMLESLSDLLESGVEANLAKTLIQLASENLTPEQLNDPQLIQVRINQLVAKSLQIADPLELKSGEPTVIAIVGSTGVGKTTTLAKIAAQFQQEQRCEVGIITLDTYRPGAVDQLLQHAETLDAALEVVSSASQFLPALQRLKGCDVVLIDTAGRSPNDHEQIQVLQELLAAAQPTSVQLVVSATSSIHHLKSALKQFAPLKPTGLVITRLDEAIGFGEWLAPLQQCDVPVSYVCHGQQVPDDIAPANRRRLASMLLGFASQLQPG